MLRVAQRRQLSRNGFKRRAAIIIVRIDHGERRVDHVFGAKHRMHRAKRLCPLRRDFIVLRKPLRYLKRIVDADAGALLDAVAEQLADILQHLWLDDDDNMVKPRAQRVIDRVFH